MQGNYIAAVQILQIITYADHLLLLELYITLQSYIIKDKRSSKHEPSSSFDGARYTGTPEATTRKDVGDVSVGLWWAGTSALSLLP